VERGEIYFHPNERTKLPSPFLSIYDLKDQIVLDNGTPKPIRLGTPPEPIPDTTSSAVEPATTPSSETPVLQHEDHAT
jgi:hypothetical protein